MGRKRITIAGADQIFGEDTEPLVALRPAGVSELQSVPAGQPTVLRLT
jgi:hypothetical protein